MGPYHHQEVPGQLRCPLHLLRGPGALSFPAGLDGDPHHLPGGLGPHTSRLSVPYHPQEGSEPHPFPQVLVRVHLSQPGGPSPQRSVWSLHPSPVGSGAVSPCLGQREVLSLLQEDPKHFPKGRRWPGYLPSAMRSQSPDPPRWCGRGVSSYCQGGRGPVPPHCGGYRFLFL